MVVRESQVLPRERHHRKVLRPDDVPVASIDGHEKVIVCDEVGYPADKRWSRHHSLRARIQFGGSGHREDPFHLKVLNIATCDVALP